MPNPRAQKPLSYEQIVKDAKSLGVPAQALLDALAGGLKGSVTATVGAPADIYNLINQASFRGQLPNIPLGSEDISKMLPDVIPTQDKSRQHTAEVGELAGSFIPTPMAGQAVKGAVKLGKVGAKALGEELGRRAVMGESFTPLMNTALPMTHVMKNKGGNWFANEVENNLRGLKLKSNVGGYTPDEMIELVKIKLNDPNIGEEGKNLLRQQLSQFKHESALNNWVDKNLTNYVKKEMGTPEDPVRLMIDKRVEEIKAKHKEDMARADKVAQRATEETDPRRQANLQREAIRLRTEADSDRELGLKHVAHFQVIDPEYLTPSDVRDVLGKLREEAGFPAKGMGKSAQAKGYENFADNAIYSKKAGQLQEIPERLALIEQAKAERIKAQEDLDRKFAQHFRDNPANLPEDTIQHLVKNLGFDHKEQLLGDDTYSKALEKHRNLEFFDDQYNLDRLKQNPYINKLTPETNIYSAQTGDLGFDHVLDVLKEDLASGRLKPEDLKNISMEQAVRKTADYDLALAKKMQEAQAKKLEEMTVHKEYPEGMRWVQLDKPGQFSAESEAMGHSVRGYEPPEGHPDWIPESGDSGSLGYGHGGWEGIKSGRAKVYSLVDPKGNPHTTVEIKASPTLTPEKREAQMGFLVQRLLGEGMSEERAIEQANKLYPISETNPSITQIKGKGNRAPNEQYLPFVQDFVKSGNWGDVGDLKNTGLIDVHNNAISWPEGTKPEQIDRLLGGMVNGTNTPLYKSTRDFTQKAQQDLGSRFVNEQEYKDWISKQLQPEPPVEGMKKGGAVTISDNPDTMFMELMDRKMQAGGAVTKIAKALAKEQQIMKASEALGKIEGRPLVVTQTDRTKVGGGYLGGSGFSGIQHTNPEYKSAEATWGVKTPGVAKMILGGGQRAGENPVYSTLIGSPTQHQSNQMVFDKLYKEFMLANKRGELDPDLRDLINERLAKAVDKDKNPIFPSDVDITSKEFKNLANTFDRRSVAGHLFGGVGVGGKKGQVIDYDKIIRSTTDPALLDVPSGSIGNRLFTLNGGIIDRPDLHPAFPTILQGEDFGLTFNPVPKELLMKDFIAKTRAEKGRDPGYMDYTRGYPPSQLITEELLTELQKQGHKKGGAIKKAQGGEISEDDIQMEVRPL